MNDTLHTLIEKAASVQADETYARRAMASMDLTSLGTADTDEMIEALCSRAVNAAGQVAAVCVFDTFVPLAKERLQGTGVRVATVCNFPNGNPDAAAAAKEARAQVAAGADEVDVVLPYTEYKAGDRETGIALLRAVREACGDAKLKVIIESGALETPELIAQASRDAIDAGADFIKTSTGKIPVGATLEAAAVMLSVIREKQPQVDRKLGFKPAGGLKSVADAAGYLFLCDSIMGEGWATPETMRFGASGLLNAVLEELGLAEKPAEPTDY